MGKNIEIEKNVAIRTLLKLLGIKPCIKGYDYLIIAIDAVKKKYERGVTDIGVCKLYEEIANVSGTTSRRVERNIRHAVEMAWNDNQDLMREFLGRIYQKPTNSEFIFTVAEHLFLKE